MDRIFQKIRSIEIQGAINIAEESLKYLKRYAKKHGFSSGFNKECTKLLKTRQTAVPLFNVINEVKKDRAMKRIDELLILIKEGKKNIARQRVLKKKSVVMTHCHSTEVVSLLKANRNTRLLIVQSPLIFPARPSFYAQQPFWQMKLLCSDWILQTASRTKRLSNISKSFMLPR